MATQRILVPAGTTSAPQAVSAATSAIAGPAALGGSVLVEYSPDGVTNWRPWSYGTITQGGSLRLDTNGWVRCTATTQAANLYLADMGGGNAQVVDQIVNTNASLASASATTEQVLLSFRLPPLFVPANFAMELDINLSMTNNANVKTLNVRWGGITGTVLYTAALASFLNYNFFGVISGRGDGSSVIGFGQGAAGGSGGSVVAYPTVSRDYINQETEVVVTITKATAGDVVQLEGATIYLR